MNKYKPFPSVFLPNRLWPSRTLGCAPIWCSVDLRDGNQALIEPMDLYHKERFFDLLVSIGYKEIEVGFPSASQTDYDFIRYLIENQKIPDDVTIQVLTQARFDLIERTFESIKGVRRAIVHVYNSTSEVQRRIVFHMDRSQIIDIARNGVTWILEQREKLSETEILLEYSPESFTGTELDFAIEICEVVMDLWGPSRDSPMILNLPATVEMSTPNVYADQIEYFQNHIRDREHFILSIHPHNDRGTAIAAAELALMAGAQRVEGTLFGNGERTGNVDLITLALNLYTQGVDPGVRIPNIQELVKVYEYCNQLSVPARHPYAGELVFTAFSGSHQDAINKGFAARAQSQDVLWEVPYLPIDPADIGRTYETVVRINSQSGKSGISYIMKRDYGIDLPRRLQIEFSRSVQKLTDTTGKEVESLGLWELFCQEYLTNNKDFTLLDWRQFSLHRSEGVTEISCHIEVFGRKHWIKSTGNGPIDAFIQALRQIEVQPVYLIDYGEHAIKESLRAKGVGADAKAVAFIEIAGRDKRGTFGVGIDESIVIASLKAVISGLNRLSQQGQLLPTHTKSATECVFSE